MYLGFIVLHPYTVVVSNELGVHLRAMIQLAVFTYSANVVPKFEDWRVIVMYIE